MDPIEKARLLAVARKCRARVLELWPEGEDLDELPTDVRRKIRAAMDEGAAAEKRLADAGYLR